jgi:hypothetical protein
MPAVSGILSSLQRALVPDEDYQYVLRLRGGQICFEIVSVLDDFVQAKDSGLLVPKRALLTHVRDTFGGFTADEIEELERLVNSRTAREHDFQAFFERNPHFLRRWDHREVHPHVLLSRADAPDLIPDFILTDRELQNAVVVELKLPSPRLIRRQTNRERFSAAVLEARAQLLNYNEWFREQTNRRSLRPLIGMDIYEPHLAVVIGRSSEFRDEFDRARLRASAPGVDVVTYDDILAYARRRKIMMNLRTST